MGGFVFVNGEGSIVHGIDYKGAFNRGGRYTIYMSWLAKVVFHKPTCLVNMTVDPGNLDGWEMIRNVFPKMDYLCTREPLSRLKLIENGVNNSRYVPDALFSYKPVENWEPTKYLSSVIDFSKPYIVLGDSTALNSNGFQSAVRWDIVSTYTILYNKLRKIMPQIVFLDGFNGKNLKVNEFIRKNGIRPIRLSNTDYHDLYHVFEHSSLFISGRWHASVLASLSTTPVLLYGADSHKTKGLYSILDYAYPFFETSSFPLHLDDVADNVRRVLKDGALRDKIREKVTQAAEESYKNVTFLKDYLEMRRGG